MELGSLNGNVIGVIADNYKRDDFKDTLVSEIITKRIEETLKMVKLESSVLEKRFSDLSSRNKEKVILASKLHDKEIILVNFSEGLIKSDVDYFKTLFRRVTKYNKKVILIDKNTELFLNCVDRIYVLEDDSIKYETVDIFDKILELYVDLPKIVDFANRCEKVGVRLDHYTELDELMKAIYRIKS